jgi:subtilisin family serine protease
MTDELDSIEIEPPSDLIQLPEPIFGFLPEIDKFLQVKETRTTFDVSGKGLAVAVMDTGLRTDHVDFAGKVVAQQNFTPDNNGDPNDANDGHGHGTHVGGIIVAGGAIHTGIAPGAGIVPLKVLPNERKGNFDWVAKALQWVIDNQAAYQITAVNVSLSDERNHIDDTNFTQHRISRLVRKLRDMRVPVIVSAGNHYFTHNSRQGMAFPAILRDTVSVGAVYDSNVGEMPYKSGAIAHSTREGQITPFSQRLHGSVNRATRTDIFAPGAPVTAPGVKTPKGTSIQQGTSQAAPVTAGIILLMQEYHLRITGELPKVSDVIRWLQRGGVTIHDGDDEDDNVDHTGQDFIRLHALTALDAVRRELMNRRLAVA